MGTLSSWYECWYIQGYSSPSRIFDPCGTVAGMVTPKGSNSTEGETLQVSVLPYRCLICAPLVMRQMENFGKFQDTDRLLIPCPRHVSSRLPPLWWNLQVRHGAMYTKKTWRDSLSIDMLLSVVSALVVAQSSSEIREGLMNNPVYQPKGGGGGWVQPPEIIPNFWQSRDEFPVPWKIHPKNLTRIRVSPICKLGETPD
jgi:hypothetical protein